MSRFKANFEALDEKKWAGFNDRIAEISGEELQNNDAATDELERLRQIAETVAASIESVQPFIEFINPDIQKHVKSFEAHLNNFEASQPQHKLSHLNNLNNVATKAPHTTRIDPRGVTCDMVLFQHDDRQATAAQKKRRCTALNAGTDDHNRSRGDWFAYPGHGPSRLANSAKVTGLTGGRTR